VPPCFEWTGIAQSNLTLCLAPLHFYRVRAGNFYVATGAGFLVVVTARFRTLYVFLLMEVGTRRIVHIPSRRWWPNPSLVHDRDSIFSAEVDQQFCAIRPSRTGPFPPVFVMEATENRTRCDFAVLA
jgi:hypothetical protein